MEFLLFIIILVVVVMATRPNKSNSTTGSDSYSKGYQDGIQSLAGRIQQLIDQDNLDKNSLKAALLNMEYDAPDTTPAISTPTINAEQQREEKEKNNLRNTNIVLYLASFLFVAAGAALIGAAVDDVIKLFGLWMLVGAFYGIGLTMYDRARKLKPAAIAFVGTGLALLPFAGVALHQYGGVSSEASWLVTSLIGVFAYFWAAIRMNSIVVSYLTLAFIISLVSSSVATASLPIVWGFISVIVVSLVASLVSYLRPKWLPSVFHKPVEHTGQIVTPITLFASIFVYDNFSLLNYEVVFGVATAHYLLAWLQSRQDVYENSARIVGHIAALLVTWDISNDNLVQFGFWFLGLATLQLIYSLIRRTTGYQPWIWTAMGLQLFANVYWFGDSHPMTLVAYALTVLGISSFVAAYAIRSVRFGLPGLGVSVLLPLIVSRQVIEPPVDWVWVTGWYLLTATAAIYAYKLWARHRSIDFKMFILGGLITYLAMAGVLSTLLDNGAGAAVMAIIGALVFVASYVIAIPEAIVITALTTVIAITRAWIHFDWSPDWLTIGVTWSTTIVLIAISWTMLALNDERRRTLSLYSAWVIASFGALVSLSNSNHSIALSASLLVLTLATSVILEGRRLGQTILIETGVYIATFGVQSIVAINMPDLNPVFYAHWWAIVIALVAYVRKQYMPRLMIAMGIITSVTGLYALSDGDSYSLLFLIEHIALVIAGVARNKSWAIWWGVAASSLAILYFLRNIAFLAFSFLGLLLIGFVMWRLTRPNGSNSHK